MNRAELARMITDTQAEGQQVNPFDRALGALHGLPDVTHTKPSTIQVIPPFGVGSQLYIAQTFRQAEIGDTIFLQCVDQSGTVRLVIPPQVAAAIARQHDQLTTKVRSKTSKRIAQERKDAGLLPGFMKGKKK